MNKEEIIDRIRELKKEKVDLNWRNIKANHRKLYNQGKEKFHGWSQAVKAASESKIKKGIKKFYKNHPIYSALIMGLVFIALQIVDSALKGI